MNKVTKWQHQPRIDSSELEKYRDMVVETLKKDENVYEEYRREVLNVIDSLENDLREILLLAECTRGEVVTNPKTN